MMQKQLSTLLDSSENNNGTNSATHWWRECEQRFTQQQYASCLALLTQQLLGDGKQEWNVDNLLITTREINKLSLCNNCNLVHSMCSQEELNDFFSKNKSRHYPQFDQLLEISERYFDACFPIEKKSTQQQQHHSLSLHLHLLHVYLTICYNYALCKKEWNVELISHLEHVLHKTFHVINSLITTSREKQNSSNISNNFRGANLLQDLIDSSFQRNFSTIQSQPETNSSSQEPVGNVGKLLKQQLCEHILHLEQHVAKTNTHFYNLTSLDLFLECETRICQLVCLLSSTYIQHKRYTDSNQLLDNDHMDNNNIYHILKAISNIQTRYRKELNVNMSNNKEEGIVLDSNWYFNNYLSIVSTSHILVAIGYRCMNNYHNALKHCMKAVDEVGDSVKSAPAIFLCAMLHFESNNLNEASQLFERCVNMKNSYLFSSMNMLGIICSKQREFIKALQWFQRASEVFDPKHHQLKQQKQILFYNLSVQYETMGNVDSQFKMLEFLWQLCKSESGTTSTDSHTDLETSITFPDYCTNTRVPSALQTLYLIARCSMNRRDYEFAFNAYNFLFDIIIGGKNRDQYSGTLETDPLIVFKEYIHVLLQIQEFAKAEAVCNHVLISYPEDVEILSYKSDALVCQERDLYESMKLLDKCISLLETSRPSSGPAHFTISKCKIQALNNKAMLLVCKGDSLDAIKHIQLALNELNDPRIDLPGPTRSAMITDLTYNLCLLSLQQYKMNGQQAMMERACVLWFELRKIPSDQTLAFYANLMERMKQKQREIGPAVIESHVLGTVTESQLLHLDLETVHLICESMRHAKEDGQ